MVNGEDNVVIVDGQNPFLLGFEPLRLFKRPAQWTMSVLAGFIVKFPILAYGTYLQNSTHRRRAAIDDCAHGFGLFIGKPMRALVFANVLAENLSHTMAYLFRVYTVRI